MNLLLRTLNISDAEMLLNFSISSFVNTYAHLNTPENMALYLSNNFTIERMKTDIEDAANIYSGIFLGNELVGYTKLRPNNYSHEVKKAIELERIYVTKDLHGMKIGQKLISNCLEFAKSNNFSELWLGVWDQNEKAIAFYKKMGFEVFSEHVFLLGTDEQNDFLMRIAL